MKVYLKLVFLKVHANNCVTLENTDVHALCVSS